MELPVRAFPPTPHPQRVAGACRGARSRSHPPALTGPVMVCPPAAGGKDHPGAASQHAGSSLGLQEARSWESTGELHVPTGLQEDMRSRASP